MRSALHNRVEPRSENPVDLRTHRVVHRVWKRRRRAVTRFRGLLFCRDLTMRPLVHTHYAQVWRSAVKKPDRESSEAQSACCLIRFVSSVTWL